MAKVDIFKEGAASMVLLKADRAGKAIDYDPTITVKVPDVPPGTKAYKATGKPIDGVPSDEKITWFTNFSVDGPRKDGNANKLQQKYSVTVHKPPLTSDNQERTLCYYDTEAKKVIDIKGPYEALVTFETDLVDPPTGFYP